MLTKKEKACPVCGSTELSENWAGYIEVYPICQKCGYVPRPGVQKCPKCGADLTLSMSEVANRLGLTKPGRYALKVKE